MASATGLPALDNTMGALFLGVIFAVALWGAGCIQLYYYFDRFPKDRWYLKALVCIVWALDTTHQALITHTCYTYLVTHYGDPAYLGVVVKSLWAMVIFSGLICLLVQLFLCHRVWRLSHKNIPVVTVLLLFVLGEFVTVLLYFIKSAHFTAFEQLPSIFNISRSINIMGAVSDIAIALVLVFLLHRSRTGFKRSETIINRLIIFSVNTGALTSLCALMSLITISVYPTTFIYITFFVCVSRLYTNTLYATLNARKSTAEGMAEDTSEHVPTSSISMGRLPTTRADIASMQRTRMVAIKVDTETTRMADAKMPPHSGGVSPPSSMTDQSSGFFYDAKKDFE